MLDLDDASCCIGPVELWWTSLFRIDRSERKVTAGGPDTGAVCLTVNRCGLVAAPTSF